MNEYKKLLIGRRDILRGMGTGMLLLNPMLTMLAAHAAGVGKRFIFVFSANGTVLNNWRPTGSATPGSLQLGSRILTPLAAYRDQITVIQGVHNNTGRPGDDHVIGTLSALTAINNNNGNVYTVNDPTGYNRGKSLDHVIADNFGFKSIVAGCQSGNGIFSIVSSAGSNQPTTPESDPVRLKNRLFAGITAGNVPAPNVTDAQAKALKTKSIFDFAVEDMKRLQSRLPADLSARLKDHADAIRDIESKVEAPPVVAPSSCSIPNPTGPFNGNGNYPAVITAQIKNMVLAMACGVSNSGVLIFGNGVDMHTHPWAGVSDAHHDLSHNTDGNTIDKITKINTWYAERFGELLGQLKSVPENGGTMLDNSIVLWGNELSAGSSHSRQNIPYVLAGGGGGRIPGGRYMTFNGRGHGELLLTIANAMGVNISSFNTGTQQLPGLITAA